MLKDSSFLIWSCCQLINPRDILLKFIDYHPEALQCFVNETDIPSLDSGELLCKVTAFGINRADLLQKQGKYPPPKCASAILGMEVSGIVEVVADSQFENLLGSPVCAMISGGGYAQYVKIKADHIIPIAGRLTIANAAAVPEVFLTAFQALCTIAALKPGDKVLVHAGASGVGTAVIQLAKHMDAQVACTTSSDHKNQACLEIGADIAINYREQDFAEELKLARFFPNVIIDVVGEGHIQKNLKVAAMDCRIVQLAMMGGRFISSLDMAKLLSKRICLQASTLRNRSNAYKSKLVAEFTAKFGNALKDGAIYPVIDKIFEVSDINQAHEYMSQNKNIGKLLVAW